MRRAFLSDPTVREKRLLISPDRSVPHQSFEYKGQKLQQSVLELLYTTKIKCATIDKHRIGKKQLSTTPKTRQIFKYKLPGFLRPENNLKRAIF